MMTDMNYKLIHLLKMCSLLTLLLLLSLSLQSELKADHPQIAALERYTADEFSAEERGHILLGELGCTSCHSANDSLNQILTPKQAPLLTQVGSRVSTEYLKEFILAPQKHKPGTTMPDLLSRYKGQEKEQAAAALAAFLSGTGSLKHALPNAKSAANGFKLYQEAGCSACHNPRDEKGELLEGKLLPDSIPLPDLKEKYSVVSLTDFLKNPLKVRPAGRMPHLNLDGNAARDIAHYLMQGIKLGARVHYTYYEGNWSELPDFSKLQSHSTGEISNISLEMNHRKDQFGVRFQTYLHLEKEGEYTFFLKSDDGSRLIIGEQMVIDNDEIHGVVEKQGKRKLGKGVHSLKVDYFEASGGEEVSLEIQGPGIKRGSIISYCSLTPEPAKEQRPPEADEKNDCLGSSTVH